MVKANHLFLFVFVFNLLIFNQLAYTQDTVVEKEGFSEFKPLDDNSDEFNTIEENSNEFKTINESSSEFNSVDNSDEFKTIEEGSDEFSSTENSDEFKEIDNEHLKEASDNTHSCQKSCATPCSAKKDYSDWYWVIGILLFTVLAGVFVRFKSTRNFGNIFLLASLFVLGFYKGGCIVCPINGLQNGILAIAGHEVTFVNLLWIIAIIPITYLLGRVYCGWICHLGALQEFLYFPTKFKLLQTEKAQKTLRIIRGVLIIALIIQLAIMGTKYWCKIDPFLNVFGFKDFFSYIISVQSFDFELILIISLLFLLLISSLFTYRPFCRTICPVGFMLGLISRIPGASVIGIKGECAGCKVCSKACKINAILHKQKFNTLRNFECISCGGCVDACNKQGLGFFRNSKKHPSKIDCKNECTIEN